MAGQAYVIRPGVECYECAVDYARGREREFLLSNHVPAEMAMKLEMDWRAFTDEFGYWCGLSDMDNDLAATFRKRENDHSKLSVAVPCVCGRRVGATIPAEQVSAVPVGALDRVGEFVDTLLEEHGRDIPVVETNEAPSEIEDNFEVAVESRGLGVVGLDEPFSLKAFLPPYKAALPPQFRGLTREQLAEKPGFAYVIMFDEAWVTSMAASLGANPLLTDLFSLNYGFFRDGVGRLIDMQPVNGVLMPRYMESGAVSALSSLVVATSGSKREYHPLSMFSCLMREAGKGLTPGVGFVFDLDDVVGSCLIGFSEPDYSRYDVALSDRDADLLNKSRMDKATLAGVDGFCYVKLLSDAHYSNVVRQLGYNPTLLKLLSVRAFALLPGLDVSTIILTKVRKGHLHLDLGKSDKALVHVADVRAFAFKFEGDTLGTMLVKFQEDAASPQLRDGGAAEKLFSTVGGASGYGPKPVLSNDAQAQALVGLPGYEYLHIVKPAFVRSVASALGQWPLCEQVFGLAAAVLSVGPGDLSRVSMYRVGRNIVDVKLTDVGMRGYACVLDVDVGSKKFPSTTLGGMVVGTPGYGQTRKFVGDLSDRVGGVRSYSPRAVSEGISAREGISAIPGFCYAVVLAPLYVREVTARLGPRPSLHDLFRLELKQVDRDAYLRAKVIPGDTVVHLERKHHVVRPEDSLAAVDIGGVQFADGTFGAAVFGKQNRSLAKRGKVGLHQLVGQATVQTAAPVSTTVAGNVYSMPMAVVIGLTVSVTANVIFLIGLIWVSIARRKKSGGGGWGR